LQSLLDNHLELLTRFFTAADFDVIEMTPEYPGVDAISAQTDYPGTLPVINSFMATDSNSNPLTNVQPGDAITFNLSVSGDTYDYIDNIGPLRLTANGGGSGVNTGSVTVTPAETQEYKLYSTNATGRASSTIQITMPSTVVTPPVFTPPAEVLTNKTTYVGISTPTSARATIYYTLTNGATGTAPTTASTLYVGSTGVNVDHAGATQTLEAIAVVNGYAEPGQPSSATYPYGTATAKPTVSPASGTYTGVQTVTISDTTAGAIIYYTTDGTTPIYPIGGTEQLYTAPITVSAPETLKAIALAPGYGTVGRAWNLQQPLRNSYCQILRGSCFSPKSQITPVSHRDEWELPKLSSEKCRHNGVYGSRRRALSFSIAI
jgi:hypothetical protein